MDRVLDGNMHVRSIVSRTERGRRGLDECRETVEFLRSFDDYWARRTSTPHAQAVGAGRRPWQGSAASSDPVGRGLREPLLDQARPQCAQVAAMPGRDPVGELLIEHLPTPGLIGGVPLRSLLLPLRR